MKKFLILLLAVLSVVLPAGCAMESQKSQGDKPFVYLTTGYGVSNGDAGLNPHKDYSGWSAVRYGVGETLFRFSDEMRPEPWLAESYQYLQPNEVKIKLRDDVYFTSGRKMDGNAVKECLDDLITVHKRARGDLKITSIEADGDTITIQTEGPCPALINNLADPYAVIIDMESGTKGNNISGTGPYRAVSVSDTEIHLEKNDHYWGKKPQISHIIVRGTSDSNSMIASLQSGIADACYGLPYDSYPLFADPARFHKSTVATSRTFMVEFNQKSEPMTDRRVRKAISMAINKKAFAEDLLEGNGEAAKGPFPAYLPFGDGKVHDDSYNPEEARVLLAQAGWEDTDGDGYVDKDGKDLTIRWLTYPSRMELPALAQMAQSDLKKIGIKVEIESSSSYMNELESGNYDIFASAFVTAPTGDPEYFFNYCTLRSSTRNRGAYYNPELEKLAQQLHTSTDPETRNALAIRMVQAILDDDGLFFATHLKMTLVSSSSVEGLTAHPCDYYEITGDLREVPHES